MIGQHLGGMNGREVKPVEIDRIREQIPVCQKMVYVNSGWSGPSPVSVVEAVSRMA